MIQILSSDKLCIDEIDLLKGLLKWGEHKAKESNKSIEQVLQNTIPLIRFGLISGKDLYNFVKPLKFVPKELYLKAMEFNGKPSHFKDENSPQFKSRGYFSR